MLKVMQNNEQWRSSEQSYTLLFIIFFCGISFYIAPIRTPFDSFFTIHTAYSFLHGHWGSLAEFVNINPSHHSIAIGKDGLPYNLYPVGSIFFSLPFVMLADLLTPNLGVLLQDSSVSMELEAVTVAFWCAIATAMMYRSAAEMTRSINIGLAAAFIFAFCSPILSTATRALWQHTPVVICILATFSLLHAAERRPNLVIWTAIPLAIAFLCRPLTVPFIVAVSIFVAVYHTRRLAPFMLVGASIAILWASYNYMIWDHALPPYYRPNAYSPQSNSWFDRIFGSIISPSRGLLVFSPIFLFSLVGVAIKAKARTLDRFDAVCIVAIIGHVWLIAASPMWWAGHSYGPRFMTDVIPLFVYLMLPALQAIMEPGNGTLRQLGAVSLLFLGAVSFLISEKGALTQEPYLWNVKPGNIDFVENHGRLWDWSDLQFLRGTQLEHGHPGLRVMKLLTASRPAPLAPSSVIDMSNKGNWNGTLSSGWYTPESWGVWSKTAEAHLRLPLQAGASGDLTLEFQAQAFVAENHPSVTVTVLAENEAVGVWKFDIASSAKNSSVTIPRRLLSREALDFTFLIDAPASPSSLGISGDGRLLGLGLSKIRVVQ